MSIAMPDRQTNNNQVGEGMSRDLVLRADMAALRLFASAPGADRKACEAMADMRLLDHCRDAIAARLAELPAAGRQGWWDPKECDLEALRKTMREHATRGETRDVLVMAAMVLLREASVPEVKAYERSEMTAAAAEGGSPGGPLQAKRGGKDPTPGRAAEAVAAVQQGAPAKLIGSKWGSTGG